MKQNLFLLILFPLIAALGTTGCGDDSCGLEPGTYSAANSGSLCQVNFFGDTDYAVYCADTGDEFDCACGAVADSPKTFVSSDFCNLGLEERACAAVEACGFPL